MARYEAIQTITLISGEAITMARFVDISAANTVTMCDAAADIVVGIAAETITAAEFAEASGLPVAISGVGYIELGATLAAGVMVS